jgi:serine/threonine protein kinase
MYITKDKMYIFKKPRNYIEEFIYEREMFWYDTLKNECFIPKLIYKDDLKKEFIIEYFGNRISIINKPQDWEEQLINILNILKEKYKWDNPDLKPTEILVSKEGKLGIIDFGWCTLNNDYKCGKGYKNNKYIDLSENIIINLRKKFM